ncbi:MAG: MFS transporter [Acidimicrobiales bacterium]
MIRPFIGPLGDRLGRRTLIVGGTLVAGAATATTALAASIPAVVAIRAVTGIGEAAVFVGIASSIQDLAPDATAGQRPRPTSLPDLRDVAWSGPLLGGWIRHTYSTDCLARCRTLAVGRRGGIGGARTSGDGSRRSRRFIGSSTPSPSGPV